MKKRIYVSRYLMHSRQGLNSRSQLTSHEGALIRVEVDGVSGYGCLHPWVELGDSSLEELLLELKQGRISRQVKCALECAAIDRKARAQGLSLFNDLEIPDSHATIVGGLDRVEGAMNAGFDTIKLKMGRDEVASLRLLREVAEAFPELKIRIDFNGVSSAGKIEYLLNGAGEKVREKIDFIEDPFPLGGVAWEGLRDKYAVKFAMDRGVGEAVGEFDVSVVKPAINEVGKLCDEAQMAGRNVVITSYMDHPLGQSYAAYCAGKMDAAYLGLVNKRCGLMTHGLYEANEFTESLGLVKPVWASPSNGSGETGLGFDSLLEKQEWQTL